MAMKSMKKIALLSSIFALSLTSCDFHKTSYCLETSTGEKYVQGMCCQIRRTEEIDTVYLINLPTNPEADPSEYIYDITWVSMVRNDSVTFVGGLKGKRVERVYRISDTVLLIDMYAKVNNQEATFGYIQISSEAFHAHTDRVKNAYLKAYVAIGDTCEMVSKPSKS